MGKETPPAEQTPPAENPPETPPDPKAAALNFNSPFDPVEENKGDPPPEKPAEDPKLSKGWDELNKRDQELVKKQQELTQKRRELEAYEKAAQVAKDDPLAAMKELGIDPHSALASLWGPEVLPEQKEVEPTEQLKTQMQSVQEKFSEYDREIKQMKIERAQEAFYKDALSALNVSRENLPIVAHEAAQNEHKFLKMVEQAALNEYDKTNVWPTDLTQTLKQLNDSLKENHVQQLTNLLKIEEVKKSVLGESSSNNNEGEQNKESTNAPPMTITNEMNAGGSQQVPVEKLPLQQRRGKIVDYLNALYKKGEDNPEGL